MSDKADKPFADANQIAGVKERHDFNQDFKLDWRDPDEATDGYQLKWIGKDYARLQTGTAPTTVIVPDSKHNVKNSESENIFLTGDNLEVLKHLQNAYRNAIKMIYIDPPYNTGSDSFVYNDKFAFTDEQLKNMLGMTDKEIDRLKTINGRSSHSAWLTFMYPRLRLARNLLKDDGVIFISIDDNEQANLKLLCDEIFGEGNFVAQLVWEKMYTTKNDASFISMSHEYLLCYAKNLTNCTIGLLPRTKEMDDRFKNPDNDVRGPWKPIPLYAKGERKKGRYPVVSPITGKEHWPNPDSHWLYAPDDTKRMIEENRIYFGKNGDSQPNIKRFLTEVQQGSKAKTLWKHNEVGSNDSAKRELRLLYGEDGIPFDFPKPSSLIKRAIQISTNVDDIIFDFFAGSGTTAHAVMQLNKEDGGNRKWILCTLDEPTNPSSEARKNGYKTIDVDFPRFTRQSPSSRGRPFKGIWTDISEM